MIPCLIDGSSVERSVKSIFAYLAEASQIGDTVGIFDMFTIPLSEGQ